MKNLKIGDVVKDDDDTEYEIYEMFTRTAVVKCRTYLSLIDLDKLKDYTLVQPKEQWSCGKCDREAKGINDSEIPNHFRTCPKASVKPGETLEEKFREYLFEDNPETVSDEAKHLAQIAAEHYKDKQD